MTLRERVRQLEIENKALKEGVAAQRALNKSIVWSSTLADVIGAVAGNVRHLGVVDQERVLLGVACLYGIIGPEKSSPRQGKER